MSWYKNIWRPRKMGIVFLHFNGGALEISVLKIGATKTGEAKRFDTLLEGVNATGKTLSYHFHVSGSGILSRKVEFLPTYRDQLIISGNPDEFVFTSYQDSFDVATSFFRKELIKEQLEAVEEHKIHLLGITSGAIPVFTILENETVELDYKIGKNNDRIDSFERLSSDTDRVLWRHDYYTGEELVSKAILGTYTTKIPSENYDYHTLPIAEENYRQFAQFKVYGTSALVAVFLSLFGNYFYQNYLNNEVAQLEQNLMMSNDNLALLDRLDQEKSRKEQLISSAGVTSSRFLSYYLDEIGKTVPKDIQLQEMRLFPVSSKLKEKQKIEVIQDQILIEGTTKGNEVLDNWIEKMDRFEWVKSIELLNYLKGDNDRAAFKLLINQVH